MATLNFLGKTEPEDGLPACRELLLGLLDEVPAAALIVDSIARIVARNEAASRLISSDSPLFSARGVVHFRAPESDEVFLKRIGIACRAGARRQVATVSLGTPGVQNGCIIVRPLSETRAGHAVIVVVDPRRRPVGINRNVLSAAHTLTATESRVVELLVQGLTVEEIADVLCISMATARTQLRNVAKTGTTRQGELIGLVLGWASPIGAWLTENDRLGRQGLAPGREKRAIVAGANAPSRAAGRHRAVRAGAARPAAAGSAGRTHPFERCRPRRGLAENA